MKKTVITALKKNSSCVIVDRIANKFINMMRAFMLIILVGNLQPGYCQKKTESSYIKEIRAVERRIYLNVIGNIDLLLPNDTMVSGGWIVVEKAAKNTSRSSIVSSDQFLSRNFIFDKKYEIKVDWDKIDSKYDSILLVRKFVFAGLDADINDCSIRFKNDMELEMIQKKYPAHKIILLSPYKDKILSRVQ